jgi:hypothetical protein
VKPNLHGLLPTMKVQGVIFRNHQHGFSTSGNEACEHEAWMPVVFLSRPWPSAALQAGTNSCGDQQNGDALTERR